MTSTPESRLISFRPQGSADTTDNLHSTEIESGPSREGGGAQSPDSIASFRSPDSARGRWGDSTPQLDARHHPQAAQQFRAWSHQADSEPNTELRARALIGMAVSHQDGCRWDEAARLYEKAIDLFESHHGLCDAKAAARLQNNLAMVYREMDRGAEAESCYLKALAHYKQLSDSTLAGDLASLHGNLAYLYFDRGDFTSALQMQKQALDITLHHLAHNPEAVFEAERRTGIFAYFADEPETALRHFKAAHHVLKDEDELGSSAAAELLVNIAATQLKSQRLTEALTIYGEAARLISQQRGPADLFYAAVLNNEGCIHLQVGQAEQALECFNRCLWAYKHNPATDDSSRAEVFHNLAVTLEKTGNTGLASVYRRSAAELLEQLTQECREKLIIATRTGAGVPSSNATVPGAERPTVQTFSRLPSPQASRVKVSRLALPIKTETVDWDF